MRRQQTKETTLKKKRNVEVSAVERKPDELVHAPRLRLLDLVHGTANFARLRRALLPAALRVKLEPVDEAQPLRGGPTRAQTRTRGRAWRLLTKVARLARRRAAASLRRLELADKTACVDRELVVALRFELEPACRFVRELATALRFKLELARRASFARRQQTRTTRARV